MMTDWYDKTIQALIKVENNTVFFRYTKPRSRRLRTMALDAMEFIRRFLQHVLPTGFMKIRYYGFLNPNCSVPFEKISTLIQMAYAFALEMPDYPERPLQVPHLSPLRRHSPIPRLFFSVSSTSNNPGQLLKTIGSGPTATL